MTPVTRKRLRKVVAMREEGKSYRIIGRLLGVSSQRARQLYVDGQKQEERELMSKDDIWCLSTRSAMGLHNADLLTKEAVIEALKTGRLKPGQMRNLGKKSIAEISAWTGFKGVCSKCGRPL